MDSIADLVKDRQPHEPPQMQALRQYVKDNHDTDVVVTVSQMGYTVVVPNAPLATVLRMELPQIQIACNLDKKLFIRISG